MVSRISSSHVHLGFDIGMARLGWAAINRDDNEPIDLMAGVYTGLSLINYDVIETSPKFLFEERLEKISNAVCELTIEINPDFVCLEKPFLKNARTAAEVFEALGVIRLALFKRGYTCVELAPAQVKKVITGKGNCDKRAVRDAVKGIYDIDVMHKLDDAWDALAIATALGEVAKIVPAKIA